MQTALLIVQTDSAVQTYELRDGKPLFAGRTAECDLCLPSPAVSRRHAVFLAKGENCGVKDLGSSNGTFLNGRKVSRPMRLRDGDVVRIGDFNISFKVAEIQQIDEAEKTAVFSGQPSSGRFLDARKNVTPPLPEPAVPDKPPPPRPPPAPVALPVPDAPEANELLAADEFNTPVIPAEEVDEATPVGLAPPEEFVETPDAPPPPSPEPKTDVIEPAHTDRPAHRPEIDIPDDEVGDGSADAAFVADEEAPDEEGEESAKEIALAKAAAEAGLVGEFMPDVDDEPAGGAENGGAEGGAVALGNLKPGMTVNVPERPDANPNAIPVDEAFLHAIETRLFLYSFLADMKAEREEFMTRRPKMADAVKAELARQDRELDKIPTPDQAESMTEKRRAKQEDLMARIRAAKEKGEPPPPKPSREMREAEEMAISQWTVCVQSGREALPAAYAEGYKLMADEPLAGALTGAGLDPVPVMGGGAYYLALEVLLEEAKHNRLYVRSKLAELGSPDEKKGGKGKGVLGLFGKGRDEDDDEEDEEEPGESYEELTEADNNLALRAAWITQEMTFMEKTLIAEFWRLYTAVALAFLPEHEKMPLAVRAFLRHGAIGFKKWWMPDEVREHIQEDCAQDVAGHVHPSREYTNILYAEEYLAAVMNWECTPAMDENLEINERNSPNWKADKALRKLINAKSQTVLMEELLGTLAERVDRLQAETASLDDKIAKILPGTKNAKQSKNELSQKRQSVKVEITKLSNLSAKIKGETLASFEEAIAETRERFDTGELPRPTQEFMIRRECDAIHKIGRLLANLKERFMPLVLRDHFAVGTDAVNDRLSIRGEILEMERRDPGLFLETIVPSKKKASRVDLRVSPIIVLIPSAGILAFSWNPRQKPEDGRLAIPTCFIRRRIRERQITYLLADFRWDTSKAAAGMDLMTSDTIVAAFMTVRWDWRKRSKEGREKGLIFTEQNDRTNWRRVYEAYSQSAFDSGKKLYNRNYDFYERIIGKYFDLPEGVQLLRK